ncbi:hypothetical protein N7450_001886 [Penicillium hetheringtonii]|uniref:Integral membrane protein TmpA n=1 Tax=Penicillium hetheringtonii TaxID=911720 RepID=A0AAD6E5G4_9EURO|nr:hypothetical protein N7450_001886 [Penicillium hetheringtonii]
MADAERKELGLPKRPAKVVHNRLNSDNTIFELYFSKKPQPKDEKTAALEDDLEAQAPAPKRKAFSRLRYGILTVYRRLFGIVFFANLAVFLWVMIANRQLLALVDATAVNLVACGLARHPMVVNAIYRIVCSVPRSAPLWIRRRAANAAHYGGVHSGCALFVVLVMIFVHEVSRAELDSFGHFLVTLPAFWLLIAAIIAVAHPWVLLRKVKVQTEPLSTHATRVHFDHTPIAFAKGIQVTKHPLRDWHSFAGFPDPSTQNVNEIQNEKPVEPVEPQEIRGTPEPQENQEPQQPRKVMKPHGHGHRRSWSIVVSKAGDWTADTIQNPPAYLWKRAVLMRGVGYGMRVFKRIIIVTTGSGIGPCLGFLGDKNRPLIKVIWQTRTPVKTYGQGVMDLVHQMGPDPIIFDTSRDGRVDMLPTVRQQVDEFGAEAVFCISNPAMTKKVIYEFESQGIPAYGPIFDS